MRPSESLIGREWLTNFHESEQPAAAILLDSLRFVSLSELWRGLLDLLRSLAPDVAPFVAYPERSLASVTRFDGAPKDLDDLIGFEHFHPGRDLAIPAGSDAFVAMVLGELGPGKVPGSIPPAESLPGLRDGRCRSAVIVTDNTVTGHQVEALARAIGRHKTIQSWRSGGYFAVRVAAYCASPAAVALLERSRWVDSVHYVGVLPTLFSAPLREEERQAAFELCRRYGWRPKLGYAGSAALFATERRAPDNMPSILLRDDPSWKPLFPAREVPLSFVREVVDHRPAEALPEVALRLGELRLGRNKRVERVHRATRDAIHVLVLASRGRVSAVDVASSLGVDVAVAANWLASHQGWGFIDQRGDLTASGRSELAEYRRGKTKTTANLQPSAEPYYHQQLR